ncbi:hypothetical protein BFP78_12305 [Gaetbulibacter sp. 5U11]|nr:hypothetical protein BFP78_12305 [Gaetbulibacter sp. 5U11]
METNFFKFQVFLFGDFDEVEASPENISFFMSKFLPHNFIPKQVQEVSLNIKGKNPEDFEKDFINRISLNSFDKKWEIAFSKDRLNFNYSFDLFKKEEFDFEMFKNSILEYLSLIEEKFNKKFHRLGVVVDKLIPVKDDDRKKFFLKFNTKSDFIGEDLIPVEWTNKIVVRKKMEELDDEIINISNMNSFIKAQLNSKNKQMDFEGIHNVIDLNTLSILKEKRFSREHVGTFLTKSNTLINEIFANNQVD